MLGFPGFTQISCSGVPALRGFSFCALPLSCTPRSLHLGVHGPAAAYLTSLGAPGSSLTQQWVELGTGLGRLDLHFHRQPPPYTPIHLRTPYRAISFRSQPMWSESWVLTSVNSSPLPHFHWPLLLLTSLQSTCLLRHPFPFRSLTPGFQQWGGEEFAPLAFQPT